MNNLLYFNEKSIKSKIFFENTFFDLEKMILLQD